MLNKEDTIAAMNHFGKRRIPFLFVINFDMNENEVIPLSEVNNSEILFNINGIKNYKNEVSVNKEVAFEKFPVDFNTYSLAFNKVTKNINAGNSYLLNLTFPTSVETNLTLKEIFYMSNARYRLWYKEKFVVFSPEKFVQISDYEIASFPMKGTIDAAIENAEEKILNDPKECAEHYTIVDLIRNDLSMIAKQVNVEKFRYIEKISTNYKTLLQVSSKISGIMDKNFASEIGTLLFRLLPAGSISGAPKRKTLEIIKEAEICNRGFYTGIFGYFSGNVLDSGVMIRFIENTEKGMVFKSGGGITSFSNVEKEYNELIDKVYLTVKG